MNPDQNLGARAPPPQVKPVKQIGGGGMCPHAPTDRLCLLSNPNLCLQFQQRKLYPNLRRPNQDGYSYADLLVFLLRNI